MAEPGASEETGESMYDPALGGDSGGLNPTVDSSSSSGGFADYDSYMSMSPTGGDSSGGGFTDFGSYTDSFTGGASSGGLADFGSYSDSFTGGGSGGGVSDFG